MGQALQSRIKQYEVNIAAHNAQVGSYNAAVQNFNAEISQYQKAVEAYNLNPTHSEYLRLIAWYASLKSQESSLTAWSNSLNSQAATLNQELYELGLQYNSYGGVLGIVKTVEMYW